MFFFGVFLAAFSVSVFTVSEVSAQAEVPTNPPPSSMQYQPQVPSQTSSGMPTGVLPPTQGVPANTSPSQFIPMALPPSAGSFVPVMPVPVVPQGVPNNYNTPSNQPRKDELRSEIVNYSDEVEERPVLVVKTSEGEFKVRVAADINRQTVAHFMGLAQGAKEFIDVRTGKKVRRPFYTGLNCHRVLKGVLIQCGCPFGNGRGNPGVLVDNETASSLKFDKPGIVAMSLQTEEKSGITNDIKDTNGSQFFISLAAMPEFTGKYSILGEITGGMDTIRKIASTPTGPTDRPIKRVVIFSIDPDIPAALPISPAISPVVSPGLSPAAGATAPGSPPVATDPMAQPGSLQPPAPGLGVDPFALPPAGP
ncbi:MAG: peptidylprolyl isomerase [Deltaproteobacteria bacterium]|nr:peptidylprolyl isomerase [Deltaproteobacteria bacterium]